MSQSCKKQSETSLKEEVETNNNSCPADGNCKIDLLKGKKIIPKVDVTGQTYLKLEKGDKWVIKYTFTKNTPQNTVDGNYTEEIFIEIDPKKESILLKNEDLSQANVFFNKQCFCKSEAGYYKVEMGELYTLIEENVFTIKFNFSINETTHILHSFMEMIELDEKNTSK